MPENEMNPDPVFDKLARFTPDANGLDRDAILFAAGRAAARSGRWWPAVAGVLVVTQMLTLVFMLLPSSPRETPVAKETPQNYLPSIEPQPDYPHEGIIQVRSDLERWPKEKPVSDPVPSGPTWTAFNSRDFSFE